LKFVSFVSVVALVALVSVVSLRVFAQHKHRAQQALYYRILYHDFTLVTSEANYRVEWGGGMVFNTWSGTSEPHWGPIHRRWAR